MNPLVVSRAAFGLVLLPALVAAADLGTLGPTYGIAEPHLLNFIEERLLDKERSGELLRLMREAQSRGIDVVRQPPPVSGLRATETPRTFYIDPTFTLDRNIVDASGPSPASPGRWWPGRRRRSTASPSTPSCPGPRFRPAAA